MPHVIVKLWPGKSEDQKQELAGRITKAVMEVLNNNEDSVSVAFEEVASAEWTEKVFEPDIRQKQELLYKKPGYGSLG